MDARKFEFDVAFSFHSADEGLATQLNDLVQDRFSTFLYSKKQEMLAGTDGEQKFNSVFSERARCVVVFHREEWGETPFTRIEETAIRNRAFQDGFDFTLFIPTAKPLSVPKWLPKPRLWYGLETYGLNGAAAVIDAKIQELGGEPRVESAAGRAARFARAADFKAEKKRFRDNDGVRLAREAFDLLSTILDGKVVELKSSHPRLATLKFISLPSDNRVVGGLAGLCLAINWWCYFRNSLDDSRLRVEVYDGPPRLPGLQSGFDKPGRLRVIDFDYDLLGTDRHGYIARAVEKVEYTPEQLAEHLLHLYIDTAEKHSRQ